MFSWSGQYTAGQDYPPAGLGLRQSVQRRNIPDFTSGLPPGRTGIETRRQLVCRLTHFASGLPPGRTGIETASIAVSVNQTMSGLPPGRTGIETGTARIVWLGVFCQDYPPAGLGLRR